MTVASFPLHVLPVPLLAVSLALIVAGSALAIYGVVNLGASFSIMSEARAVVTEGIYRFVRHPIYLFEDMALIGLFLQYISPYTAIIVFACLALQIKRINNEEAVLQKSFPAEYASYKTRTTARLIPGIY